MPSLLKNPIDAGSRPFGQSVWNEGPATVVSVSHGALGAFGANHHVRQGLIFVNMPAVQQPRASLGKISELIPFEGKSHEREHA